MALEEKQECQMKRHCAVIKNPMGCYTDWHVQLVSYVWKGENFQKRVLHSSK